VVNTDKVCVYQEHTRGCGVSWRHHPHNSMIVAYLCQWPGARVPRSRPVGADPAHATAATDTYHKVASVASLRSRDAWCTSMHLLRKSHRRFLGACILDIGGLCTRNTCTRVILVSIAATYVRLSWSQHHNKYHIRYKPCDSTPRGTYRDDHETQQLSIVPVCSKNRQRATKS
jgi:hypothetical protein